MAKRGRKSGRSGTNKSQAIRDFMAKNPAATPKHIREGLLEQGVDASIGLISAVKYGGKQAKSRGSRVKRVLRGRRGRANGSGLSVDDLMLAKQFVDQIGGLEAARQAIDTLGELA